jgi:Zn-dependent peptidase ImmA (M78 family)/transcriptional regulator with XRE-family HTH domain
VVEGRIRFNPSRLTLARKRNGLTKTALAEKIGVELRSISGYEADEYPPSEESLSRIELVLGFPSEFYFEADLDEITENLASFRSLSKMSASTRDMALTQGSLALHLNKWLDGKFELPIADIPDFSHEPTVRTGSNGQNDDESPADIARAEGVADAVRRIWEIGEAPIRNMIHLLESRGARVFSLAVKAREVDAFSFWKDRVPFIFLNTNKSSEHSRFDAAHELAHLVLHKHAEPQGRAAEREADAFASAFLMPRGSVLAYAPRFPSLPGLIQLKKRWITSVAALNYRLHAVGITTDWQYRMLCVQIAKRGYRLKEPEEAPREGSQVLPKVFSSLYEEGMTRAAVAKELKVPLSELEQLLFGLAMTGLTSGKPSAHLSNGTRAALSRIK